METNYINTNIKGIAILGLNGAGKSTLAHALSKELGYFEVDAEDYYFPEQRASRQWALDHQSVIPTEHLGEIPFSVANSKEEAEPLILEDILRHEQFILSGVMMNWCEEILSRIEIAFLIKAPAEERVRRIEEREVRRFGDRVLAGGDMYEQQLHFRNAVAAKSVSNVEASAAKLKCPVIELDGMLLLEEKVEIVKAYLRK